MVTGEKAGTWGTITNTNLQILEQASTGYLSLAVGGADVALTLTDGATSNGKNIFFKLTGTLTGNRVVTMPDSSERVFAVQDATDRSSSHYTLTVKTVSGTGVLVPAGSTVQLYSDGTNVVKANEYRKWRVISAAETVQAGAKLLVNTNGGSVTVTLPASPATGDEVHFVDQGYDFNSNALVVGRNGSNIANAASNLTVNTQGAAFGLVFSGDATTGWTYTEK